MYLVIVVEMLAKNETLANSVICVQFSLVWISCSQVQIC